MAERTCSERGCNKKPDGQGLCASHYGKAYRRGNLQLLLAPVARHSLSDINREQKTGTCSICGPVGVRIRTDRSAECMTARREQDARRRAKSPRRNANYRPSPEAVRRELLRRNFRMTPGEYLQMLDRQGGVCAICRQSQEGNLSVDHDHRCCPGKRSCGKCIRGLLCRACNLALGYMRDDQAILAAAIEYLTGASATVP